MASANSSSLDSLENSLPPVSSVTVKLFSEAADSVVTSAPLTAHGANERDAADKEAVSENDIHKLSSKVRDMTVDKVEIEIESVESRKKNPRDARKEAAAMGNQESAIAVKDLNIFNVVNTSDVLDPDATSAVPSPPHLPTASFPSVVHKTLGPLRYMLVSKAKKVALMLDIVTKSTTKLPSIFIDLEGVNLGARNGQTCVMQMFHTRTRHLFLVDLHLLQSKAFTTPSMAGTTLKDMLGNAEIGKGMFDLRNDQAGLFRNFGIILEGVYDIQLLALLANGSPTHRSGLEKVIFQHCKMTTEESELVRNTKRIGKMLFAPEHGGSYEVFKTRPMSKAITAYSLLDTVYLPLLCENFLRKLSESEIQRALDTATSLAKESCEEDYEANGSHKKYSPWVSYDSDCYD